MHRSQRTGCSPARRGGRAPRRHRRRRHRLGWRRPARWRGGSPDGWPRRPGPRRPGPCARWEGAGHLEGMTRARSAGRRRGPESGRGSRRPRSGRRRCWAGVRPAAAMAASTSTGSPPRTALMPVGVAALAWAIPRPRSATKVIASWAESTPAAAAAVISPTECPEIAPAPPRRRRPRPDRTGPWWRRCRRPRSAAGRRPCPDGVLVAGRAVRDEIGRGRLGERAQQVAQAGHLQPRGEEAWGLGALSGAHDRQHPSRVAHPRACVAPDAHRLQRTALVGIPQMIRVAPRPGRATSGRRPSDPRAGRDEQSGHRGVGQIQARLAGDRPEPVTHRVGVDEGARAVPSTPRPPSDRRLRSPRGAVTAAVSGAPG